MTWTSLFNSGTVAGKTWIIQWILCGILENCNIKIVSPDAVSEVQNSVANKRYRIAICDALFNALRYKINFVSQ